MMRMTKFSSVEGGIMFETEKKFQGGRRETFAHKRLAGGVFHPTVHENNFDL